MANFFWNNTTGNWQTAADWTSGQVPGPTDTAIIGQGAVSGFVLATGASPVSVGSITVDSGSLQATSFLEAETVTVSGGTVEVTPGNTLTVSGLVLNGSDALVRIDLSGILSGGSVTISSGEFELGGSLTAATSIAVSSGGNYQIDPGATGDGAAISGGGRQFVYGNESSATLFSGGSQIVEFRGYGERNADRERCFSCCFWLRRRIRRRRQADSPLTLAVQRSAHRCQASTSSLQGLTRSLRVARPSAPWLATMAAGRFRRHSHQQRCRQ